MMSQANAARRRSPRTHNQSCIHCDGTHVWRKSTSRAATHYWCCSCKIYFSIPSESVRDCGGNAAWKSLSEKAKYKSEWLGTSEELRQVIDRLNREDYQAARKKYYARRKEQK